MSIPLFAAEVWGLQFYEELESIRLNFLKRLLTLPQYTPGYMLRLETGTHHVMSVILSRALGWWAKATLLPETRFPKMCLIELAKLPESERNPHWLHQMQSLLEKCKADEYVDLWDLTSDCRFEYYETAKIETPKRLEEKDLERLASGNSRFSSFYDKIKSNAIQEMYLSYPISFHKKRIFAQLRLHPDRLNLLNLYIDRSKTSFSPTAYCSICNAKDNDDLFHMFSVCPIYQPFRAVFRIADCPSRQFMHRLLRTYDCDYVHGICALVRNAMRLRSFCLNE